MFQNTQLHLSASFKAKLEESSLLVGKQNILIAIPN